MKFELEPYRRNISDKDILDDIITTMKLLKNDTITREQYRDHGKYGTTTVSRRFGSWGNVLKKLNLKVTRYQKNKKISYEDLFANIEYLWRKFGRQPRCVEFIPPNSKFSIMPYKNRFGSYWKSLEAFIKYIDASTEESLELSQNKNVAQRKKKDTSRDINLRLRFKVMSRDNFKCVQCGKSPALDLNTVLHVDHIIPYSKGGETIIENLQTLCSKCNLGKSDEL